MSTPASSAPAGFGSFHSPSVEYLVSLPTTTYTTSHIPRTYQTFSSPLHPHPNTLFAPHPSPPASRTQLASSTCPSSEADLTTSPPSFPLSKQLRTRLFCLSDEFTFLNHGAFGAALRPALDVAFAWSVHMETQPLRFIDRQLLPLLVYVVRRLAVFIGASTPSQVVPIPNVTTGLSSVFSSIGAADCPLVVDEGAAVVHLNIAYGSVKKMLRRLSERSGAQLVQVDVHFNTPGSCSAQDIVHAVETALIGCEGRARLAVFDGITSTTGLMLPVQELVALCKKFNVFTVIDGAHCLGSTALDMAALDADVYVSNAHKWLASAKGCAFLYCREEHCAWIRPSVISHGADSGFLSSFIWCGLRDYGPWLSLVTVLDVWEALGPARVREYIHNTVMTAARQLAKQWGTSLLAKDELYGPMVTVRLPGPDLAQHDDEHNEIQDRLHFEYAIEVPIKKIENRLYVRISAHIYNTLADYSKLGDAIMTIRGSM